jgi:hypothetical protein
MLTLTTGCAGCASTVVVYLAVLGGLRLMGRAAGQMNA